MVDPNVHFHVIPRYATSRRWGEIDFADAGWPGVPRLDVAVNLDARQLQALVSQIASKFRYSTTV
jgi:diadenosine tetraphosphate (Ap4A) HIT family hydrolase